MIIRIRPQHGIFLSLAASLVMVLATPMASAEGKYEPDTDKDRTMQSDTGDQRIKAHDGAGEGYQGSSADQTGSPTRDTQGMSGDAQGPDSLERLSSEHSDLSTFIEALKAAGLNDALMNGDEYTVFAPTNSAFEETGRVDTLMKQENRRQLVSLLRAHIVADDVDEQMAENIPEARTIDGGTVALSSGNGELKVGDASVVESDIQLGNLRVYAIDKVLSPERGMSDARPASAQRPSDTKSMSDTGEKSPGE